MARPKGSKNKKPGKRAAKAAAAAPAPAVHEQPSTGSAAVSHEFKKPTADQVKALVKKIVSRNNEARTISQTASELVAKAVENQHFDKKAFSIVKGLYQMSINRPEAFAITLPHLLAYIDDLNLAKTADDARGFDLEGQDDDYEDEAADEQPAGGKSPGLKVVPKSDDVPSPGEQAA